MANCYYGKSDIECLQIDQLLNLISDYLDISGKVFLEADKDKKAELLKSCKGPDTQRYFGYFERLLKQNGTSFFVGKELTLADIAVFDLVTGWMKNFMGPIDNFPLANALVSKVAANDKIKAYVAKRKVTEG
ncbi:glutathione S-transferase-like [Aplysia californica]|uniref:Glutathione S-transferase-like n=1 Tax=Aplysia californica TaxID=6500 RepID=A0ABM1VW42_APLCA|nr:glutathione S-transferase-like [Aplysia californica]